jgi:ribosome biogenesis GTPase
MSTFEEYPGDRGVVIKKNSGLVWVRSGGQTIACTLSQHLLTSNSGKPGQARHKDPEGALRESRHGDPLAVGDVVCFSHGQVVAIQPRRNRLARRSAVPMPGAHPFEQVIAANVDLMVPVLAAAAPAPRWNLLDRFLVSAESLELTALVCITKLDLAHDPGGQAELAHAAGEYRAIGYPVIFTSTRLGAGINELRAALAGKTAVLVGKSGVGKTSLLNALQPDLGRRVAEVNPVTHKGRHTTSAAELYPFEFGGALVDTPGVREFGLWDVEQDDLALFFPEMRPYIGRCRFGLDCAHSDEPGCAIRKAVMAGEVSPHRYYSYLKLREEGYYHD